MKNLVLFKGVKDGIIIILDEEASFEQIKKEFLQKIKDATKFFDNAKIALRFEGKKLNSLEYSRLIDIIKEETNLTLVYIFDNEDNIINKEIIEKNHIFNSALSQEEVAEFYNGTIRSGQSVECENSIVILGDVNPGGNVTCHGNVIVLGNLKGTVYAGKKNENAFIAALSMQPMQMRIGNVIGRAPDPDEYNYTKDKVPQLAYVHKNNIYIESINSKVLNTLRETVNNR